MVVELTAKIGPKGGTFEGMVDAGDVIGTISGGGYLPSSCINEGSISESYLRISNSATDGYYLQYKDTTDELTWAAVVGGEGSLSGPLEDNIGSDFTYGISGLKFISSQAISSGRILGGGYSSFVTTQTTTYTATSTDTVILCNGTFTVTLPAAASSIGKIYVIKNIGTGIITVDGSASETIDDETTQILHSYSCMDIVCDGTEWWII
jgi:hypothetical protein